MPEWLEGSIGATTTGLPPMLLATRLGLAFLLGCVVTAVYRLTCGRPSTRSASLMATLVLLAILIAMVTLVIGNSVARAFSLVGALSIVRFRTVVEDTRDTAFVIFAVAIGMAAGSGYVTVPIIGIPLVALAAVLFRPRDAASFHGSLDCTLTVRIGLGRDPQELLRPVFESHLQQWNLTSTSTVKQGAAILISYATRLQTADAVIPFVTELNLLEGIQEVDLRRT